ncbi:MAG: PLP-dependent aminotransferase family protein [Clostridia bacterium]|nr:PLP-dependent aminotransferase family protein [Clostridia bacterium]
MITLRDSDNPLYFQIYSQLKEEIEQGRLRAGDKLFSKRKMAESLNVSVNTVETAYSQLLSEGFIESRPKSGFYVSQIDSFNFGEEKNAAARSVKKTGPEENIKTDFATDGIDTDSFPYNTWRKLMKNCFNEYNPKVLKSAPPEGDYELRKAVAQHIYSSRGVSCDVDRVIIGAGVDNLLNTISGILGTGCKITMEEPVYYEAYSFFRSLGHDVSLIPVDERGLRTDMLPDDENRAVYITPSHQFPLGITMPAGRRIKLLNWAYAKDNRYIIEDDYDSEFRYNSKPIPSVQSIDKKGRVIYLGTFSKTIAPSVRISYMVLPEKLMEFYNEKYTKFSSAVSVLDQNILTAFINEGHYERHLNRMRKLYGEKRAVLLEKLRSMGGKVIINGENAGHHMAVKLMTGMSEEEMVKSAAAHGIRVYPISKYFVNSVPKKYSSTVLMGYAGLTEKQITEGIKILDRIWV